MEKNSMESWEIVDERVLVAKQMMDEYENTVRRKKDGHSVPFVKIVRKSEKGKNKKKLNKSKHERNDDQRRVIKRRRPRLSVVTESLFTMVLLVLVLVLGVAQIVRDKSKK